MTWFSVVQSSPKKKSMKTMKKSTMKTVKKPAMKTMKTMKK